MLPRKVKRNHDLSHSNNCALFWAEKVRMTAQENLLSKAPSGWERYRVDAAVLEPGNLFLLPRLCFGELSNKTLEPRDQLLTICCCSRWADGASDAWANRKSG